MNRSPEQMLIDSQLNKYAQYAPTVTATAIALTSALFLPLVLAFVAWQIGPPFERVTLSSALCRSLYYVIPIVFVFGAIGNALKRESLAEKYLSWPPKICAAVFPTARRMMWVFMPLLVIYTMLDSYDGGSFDDSLGRIVFVVAMCVMAHCLWQTIRGINRHCSQKSKSGQKVELAFWQRALLGLISITPIALSVISLMGYHFTAIQMSWRLLWTLGILMSVALFTSLVSRLLLTTQFRLKLRHLHDSRVQGNDENDIDIKAISAQVNRLLRVTAIVTTVVIAWQIWSGVLPAISYLDDYELWKSATSLADNGVQRWVSLKDLLVSMGILTITFVLSRNLPGILEIVLLERLPLDRGGRYAISFVCRYLVGIIGLLLMFQWLGFAWSSVQWLAAGLTVGLGFGLQEIFANLVSGIIILIERPIRVGDFVTVNGTTGHVTSVQLRATTIKDPDHRELIVPNKKFITEDVMNWTLSDQLTRVVIEVGIAYGSDTKLAQQTLLDVGRANRLVKSYPAPEAVFRNFGDSTLNFELRVVIGDRDKYYDVTHQLNMAVDKAFRDAAIEIAFPQQDIHIRGLEGLGNKVLPNEVDGKTVDEGVNAATKSVADSDREQAA